jgi:hypothetical protein
MATARAVLRRRGGIDRDKRATGPRCLVRRHVCELGPRGVMDTLGMTMVLPPPVDRQVFDADQITGAHDAPTTLVGAVAATPGAWTLEPLRRVAPL